MEMAYLGIYEWVFEKVLRNIVTPMFDMIVTVINLAMGYVFNYILGPIVLPILQGMFYYILRAFQIMGAGINYSICVILLTVLECLEKTFNIFIGLEPVVYKGESGTLLEVLMRSGAVQNAFWVITFGGVGIALLLTIYGVARSSFDLDFENKRPVSHVLKQLFKSLTGAFLIPFMVWFMIQLSVVILTTINTGLGLGQTGGKSTLGSTVFVLATTDAAWDGTQNMSAWRLLKLDEGVGLEFKDVPNENFDIMDAPRKNFYLNDPFDNYKNMVSVVKYFDLSRIDYNITHYVGGGLVIILFLCFLTVIRRIFEIIMLYLVSPYFVAMMPLDDGEKFKQWFGMFVGKLFTGYGTLVAMKIYLMLMPMVLAGGVHPENLGLESRYLMYALYLLGGAWAVYKSGSLLTGLVNEAAGRMEQESNRDALGTMMMLTSPVRELATHMRNKAEQKLEGYAKDTGKKLRAEFSAKRYSSSRPKPPKPAKFKKAVINKDIKQRPDIAIGGHREGAGGRPRARQLQPVSKAALENKSPKVKAGKHPVKHIDYSKDKRPLNYTYYAQTPSDTQGANSQGGHYTSHTDTLATPKEISRVRKEAMNFSDPGDRAMYVSTWLQQRAETTGREMHIGYWDRTRLENTFNCDLKQRLPVNSSGHMVIRPKANAGTSKGDKK